MPVIRCEGFALLRPGGSAAADPAARRAGAGLCAQGRAINLFVRDLPRLSVDIDLVYLPLKPRAEALAEIAAALARIADNARKMIAGASVTRSPRPDAPKLVVQADATQVKIEPNAVLRGSVYPPETRSITPEVEALFGRFVAMPVVSLADLYGGKLVAALDRQHPRDLFDVMLLLANEGIGDDLRRAFVVYLASHGRTIAEVLEPTRKPLAEIFEAQFAGMARIPVTVAELDAAREAMIRQIGGTLTESERQFLLSVKLGEPDWNLLPMPHLAELPAMQWKIRNIRALAASDPQRHEELASRLRVVLGI